MQKKFRGSFQAAVSLGREYQNPQRFKGLVGDGKPLWEFKEFDHRIICIRTCDDRFVEIVLLHGWVKDKEGKSKQEKSEIAAALGLYREHEEHWRQGGRP